MKIEDKDLIEINKRMSGWKVVSVESGCSGEIVFIINLEKEGSKRTVKLAANNLGGWIVK